MAEKRDVVIIGAGPAGYATAFLAADLGKHVTIIDPEANPGGVCLYRGCIPTKALLHAVKTREEAMRGSEWGITFGEPDVDLEKLRNWKKDVVEKLTRGTGKLAKRRKIEHIRGMATFIDDRTLSVRPSSGDESERTLSADQIVIATGARPVALPLLPDHDRVWTSREALELPSVPERLLVIGAGYIGLELSYVYSGLGSEVEIVEMTDGLMPGADRDLVKVFERANRDRYSDVLLSTRVESVEADDAGAQVTFSGDGAPDDARSYDVVLSCVGRAPVVEDLGLDSAGVELDDDGFIRVDSRMRTSQEHIFAVGDVAGPPLLAHTGHHEGRVAARVIAGDEHAVNEPAAVPAVEYTEPEIAWCGVTETSAAEDGRDVKTATFPWTASGRAVTMGGREGLTKLVIDGQSERIIGVGIAGAHAGELIPEGVLAIEMASVVTDLEQTIHPHPTLSETLMEAAARYHGDSTHI